MTSGDGDGERWYRVGDGPGGGDPSRAWPRGHEPPASLLARHGARVLPAGSDGAATVYRGAVLLAPAEVLRRRPDLLDTGPGALDGRLNELLADTGWYLSPLDEGGEVHGEGAVPLVLVQRSDLDREARPERLPELDLDAARALRHLRLAARGGDLAAEVAELGLDHLLFATTGIGGLPVTEGHPVTEDHGDPGRVPVAVLAPPPHRRPLAEIPGGRRPVIAVLDTSVGQHPWFGPAASGGFHVDAAALGWKPGSGSPGPETSGVSDPLIGTLDTHAGHGTFIAGLVRQIAPDATVVSLPVMHGDGVVYESHLVNALAFLDQRASQGDPFVDVVCLALGYHVENAKDAAYTGVLAQALGRLGQRGVQVVASAGNDATNRPTYPAALTVAAAAPPTPLVSVGSLNPNGTRSSYSNTAPWVTDWDRGTAVVSTLPAFDGSRNPVLGVVAAGGSAPAREALDPDDFAGGFARWSGTSFAAAVFAARIAQAMLAAAGPGGLLATDPVSARQRAAAALAACRSTP